MPQAYEAEVLRQEKGGLRPYERQEVRYLLERGRSTRLHWRITRRWLGWLAASLSGLVALGNSPDAVAKLTAAWLRLVQSVGG
jgi:hypothetical protein